jgi:hypothetical protein
MLAQGQHIMDIHDGSTILWTLDDHGLTPISVRTGLSDETHSEVTGQNLVVGTKIVVGVLDAGGATAGDASSNNPFQSPRPSGGDKGG